MIFRGKYYSFLYTPIPCRIFVFVCRAWWCQRLPGIDGHLQHYPRRDEANGIIVKSVCITHIFHTILPGQAF